MPPSSPRLNETMKVSPIYCHRRSNDDDVDDDADDDVDDDGDDDGDVGE